MMSERDDRNVVEMRCHPVNEPEPGDSLPTRGGGGWPPASCWPISSR